MCGATTDAYSAGVSSTMATVCLVYLRTCASVAGQITLILTCGSAPSSQPRYHEYCAGRQQRGPRTAGPGTDDVRLLELVRAREERAREAGRDGRGVERGALEAHDRAAGGQGAEEGEHMRVCVVNARARGRGRGRASPSSSTRSGRKPFRTAAASSAPGIAFSVIRAPCRSSTAPVPPGSLRLRPAAR
jgi:hypothetical protein